MNGSKYIVTMTAALVLIAVLPAHGEIVDSNISGSVEPNLLGLITGPSGTASFDDSNIDPSGWSTIGADDIFVFTINLGPWNFNQDDDDLEYLGFLDGEWCAINFETHFDSGPSYPDYGELIFTIWGEGTTGLGPKEWKITEWGGADNALARGTIKIAQIPIPGLMWLLIPALIGLVWLRKRSEKPY